MEEYKEVPFLFLDRKVFYVFHWESRLYNNSQRNEQHEILNPGLLHIANYNLPPKLRALY